jgi:hypothetical protein
MRDGFKVPAADRPRTRPGRHGRRELKNTLTRIEQLAALGLLYDQYRDEDDIWFDAYATAGLVPATGADQDYRAAYDDGYLDLSRSENLWTAVKYWGQEIVDHSVTNDWTNYWTGALPEDEDLVRSNLIIALALAYDWAYPRLTLSERRQWRAQLAEEMAELEADHPRPAFDFGNYNKSQKLLLTGHQFATQAAVGIGTAVLWREMDGSTLSTTRDFLALEAESHFTYFLAVAGDDGASSNGVFYFENYLAYYLRYVEALRRQPDWTDATVKSWWYEGEWVAMTPGFLAQRTELAPQGSNRHRERVPLGDSGHEDGDGPSYQMARIADELDSDIAQREAWLGHNRRSYDDYTRRDVLDVLWFDESLTPKSGYAGESEAVCRGRLGEVEIRSSWDREDSVHLVYKGGRMIGGHDDPYIGAFTLWRDGWLVTAPGEPGTTKRTPTASTLLVDGKGQHHDGRTINQQVPEPSTTNYEENNSRMVG